MFILFQVLAIVNSDAMITELHIFFELRVLFLWIYAQEWNHMDPTCWIIWRFSVFSFKETPYCFSIVMHQFTFLPTVLEGSHFPTTFSAFTTCIFLNFFKILIEE